MESEEGLRYRNYGEKKKEVSRGKGAKKQSQKIPQEGWTRGIGTTTI